MKEDQKKEIVQESMKLMLEGCKQISDATERLKSVGIKITTYPFGETEYKTYNTKCTLQVYKGLPVMAECLGKETFNPVEAVFEEKIDKRRLAFVLDDVLVFELGKEQGYEFP